MLKRLFFPLLCLLVVMMACKPSTGKLEIPECNITSVPQEYGWPEF